MCRPTGRPGLIVDPEAYQRIVQWCEAVVAKPTLSEADWETAPGLVLIRPDGMRDCLAIRDLFHRNDRLLASRFVIQQSGAHAGGELPSDACLTKNEARIGEFLYFLGDWPRIYREAALAVREFPCGGTKSPRTLATVIPDSVPGSKLIRLVAVVFQWIRHHWHGRDWWRSRYFDTQWNPREMAFGDPCEQETLRDYLKTAHSKLRVKSGWQHPTVLREPEVMEGLAAHDWAGLRDQDGDQAHLYTWVQFHIDLLVAIGMAERTSDGYLMAAKPFPAVLPPCPPEFRPSWVTDLVGSLGESFGCKNKSDGSQVLRRFVAAGLFGGASDEAMAAGTKFLQDMGGGTVPPWLRELGREYAINELGWPQDCHWPNLLA